MIAVGEQVGTTGTDEVVRRRHVDLGLHVTPVEVVVRAGREGGEAHLVPDIGAVVDQVVNVKTRVDVQSGCDDGIEHVAVHSFRRTGELEGSWRRESSSVLVEVVGISAGVCQCSHTSHECVVEPND